MSTTTVKPSETRDLDADLAVCEAATPGPWIVMADGSIATEKTDRDGWHDGIIVPRTPRPGRNITQFVAAARQGWPYAIRRAQEAEAKFAVALKWINHIKDIGSPTSMLATAALCEIEAVENQFPLGRSKQEDTADAGKQA